MPKQPGTKIFHSNRQTEMSTKTIFITLVQIVGACKGKLAAQLNQVTKNKKSKERRSISWLKITLANTFRLVFFFLNIQIFFFKSVSNF